MAFRGMVVELYSFGQSRSFEIRFIACLIFN